MSVTNEQLHGGAATRSTPVSHPRGDSFPRAGVLAALALPTDSRGRLLASALAGHLRWLKAHCIHGVLALGSTGEFLRFSALERRRILARVAELAAPLPVVANISDLRLPTVRELGRTARALGLPGVALMPPAFYRVSADDQLAWLLRGAEAAALPVMLYNFPELTGNRLAPETIAAFAERAPLVAIKQSGAEFDYHRTLVALGREKNFVVFSGADTRLPEAFTIGAVGCIGGMVNFVPDLMVAIEAICRRGEAGDVETPAERMREIGRILARLGFPLDVATGMLARGLEPGRPKVPLSAATQQLMREAAAELRQRFAEWELPPVGPEAERD